MILTLLLAIALDILFGDPPNQFHPVVMMGSLIRFLANRTPAKGNFRQFIYGTTLIMIGIVLFTAPLILLNIFISQYSWLAIAINAVLLKTMFSMRRLLEAGHEVEIALAKHDLVEARRVVSWHLVSRDTRSLSEGHIASAATESLAENLTDSFVAPLLAFAIGGLPLAWAYRFVNTADAMIGYHSERYEYLGKFTARLDDVLNWIPSRLAGMLIVIASPFVNGSAKITWQVMVQEHRHTASPNAGWTMAAAAGALGVTLEKIGHYQLVGGIALPDPQTIVRARQLILIASILASAIIALLCWRA